MSGPDESSRDDLTRVLTPTSEAPADLDARIRARAHAAVRNEQSPPTVRGSKMSAIDPGGGSRASSSKQQAVRRPSRWYRVAPVAAVLVIAIGVVPLMRDDTGPDERAIESIAPSPTSPTPLRADRSAAFAVEQVRPDADGGADAVAKRETVRSGGGGSADAVSLDEMRAILSMLRAGERVAAAERYRRWRQAMPDTMRPVLPGGLDRSERRWFAQQARAWAPGR